MLQIRSILDVADNTGAKRAADRDFTLSSNRAGQQQTSHVSTGNQKDQAGCAHQQEQ